jgi:hypothetical protein
MEHAAAAAGARATRMSLLWAGKATGLVDVGRLDVFESQLRAPSLISSINYIFRKL